MDSDKLRIEGKRMIDVVADYWETMRDRKPLPDIQPGFMNELVPSRAPTKPEDWDDIFNDIERVVFQGATHWHHPHFFAYFPTACNYQSILGDILSSGLANIGFSWKSCPSMTELEMSQLDWLVDLLGLPQHFKNSVEGPGCGIVQSTASDSTLIAILTARASKVEEIKNQPSLVKMVSESEIGKTFISLYDRIRGRKQDEDDVEPPYYHDAKVFERFIMYCSDQAHSSIEKGAMLAGIRLRKLRASRGFLGNYEVSPDVLKKAIKDDRARGYVPFMYLATVGTTSTCGVDQISVLGPICNEEGLWLHVDAAYAGSFVFCDEYKYLIKGIEHADSYNFNLHKAGMITFDCSPMWFKNGAHVSQYFNVDAAYLAHIHQGTATDYRHLQVALGRRFRSLKIWFVLRSMGVEKICEFLRTTARLATEFAKLMEDDGRFDLFVPAHLGLVTFRLKNSSNEDNEKLCNAVNDDRRIHFVPSTVHGVYFMRIAVCSQLTNSQDMKYAKDVIAEMTTRIFPQLTSSESTTPEVTIN